MTAAAEELARERRRWAAPGSRWDQIVGFAKRALPIAGGAVLAACLIWPLTHSQEFSFVLSKDRVEMASERMRIERPLYRGEDSSGRSFAISATTAVQESSATPVVELTDLEARLAMEGGVARVTAPGGSYDMDTEALRIAGPVEFRRPDGYTLRTEDVSVDLPTRRIVGEGRIEGEVPLGNFAADRLDADVEERRVVLTGNTRMRIVQR